MICRAVGREACYHGTMDGLDPVFLWLDYSAQLLQRVCVVVTAAFVCIRIEWLRRALRGADIEWRCRLRVITVFGLLAMVGTHSGIVVDMERGGRIADWPLSFATGLQGSEAVINFRDLIVIVAGLIGGPWSGLGAGLLAGGERYLLGGFSALACGLCSPLVGLLAGLARRSWPDWAAAPRGAVVAGIVGAAVQKALILVIVRPWPAAVGLIEVTTLPTLAVNALGGFLFLAVVRDLDRDRLEHLARQVELRALQARIEPHFLNNTLNAIKALIRLDPERARAYVVKLGEFLSATREYAGANSIRLGEALTQLRRYVDFQALRFADALEFREDVAAHLHACHIPPQSLQTLVENALTHGFPGPANPFELTVSAEEKGDVLILRVSDNGRGIPPERLADLGRRPVRSERGCGTALFQLAQVLALVFGSQAGLAVSNRPDAGTDVMLTVPKRHEPW